MVKPLKSFPRPDADTGLGCHGSTNWAYPLGRPEHEDYLCGELAAMNVRWLKLLALGDSADRALGKLRGIMPIVRYIRHQPNGNPPDLNADDVKKTLAAVVRHERDYGVRYREYTNEPNYNIEWKDNWLPPLSVAIAQTVGAYVKAARWSLEHGLSLPPLIPAPTPTDGMIRGATPTKQVQESWQGDGITAFSDVLWLERFLALLADKAPDIVESGIAIACHNAALNHPIDFPNDKINVDEWTTKGYPPDITQFWFPDGAPTGWSNCWRKYEAYDHIARKVLGASVPILSTEGGFWQWPADDPRYPPMTQWLQAERTQQAAVMMGVAPSYYLCSGHWCLLNRWAENPNPDWERDAWYHGLGEHLPVVDVLKATVLAPRPSAQEDTMVEDWRLRQWAYNAIGVPLDVNSTLRQHARRHNLGAPLGGVLSVTHEGVEYAYQPYALGIVYAGGGAPVQHLEW